MNRILSRHGNVIVADFRPRRRPTSLSVAIQVKSEILYCDGLVCLTRFTLIFDGKAIQVGHVMEAPQSK